MSLVFGANLTDIVNVASASSINDLTDTTVLMWVYPTTITSGRRFWGKLTTSGSFNHRFIINGTAELELFFRRSGGTNTSYITNNSSLTTNKWWLIGFTLASAPTTKIYVGDLATLATERTYATSTAGTTARDVDAGQPMVFGNSAAVGGNVAFQGRIGPVGVWNRVLTVDEIADWQFRPRKTSGCVILHRHGWNGTTNVPDWSGNANTGTITGATVGDDVPLGPAFSSDTGRSVEIAASAITGTVAVTEGADTAAFAGAETFTGTIAATQAADTAAFAGVETFTGTITAVQGADTASFTGVSQFTGTIAATEGADTAVFTGVSQFTGTIAATEAADTADFAGVEAFTGTVAAVEGADTAAFDGLAGIRGTVAAVESADVAAFDGTVVTTVTGTIAAVEGADTASFVGVAASGDSTTGGSGGGAFGGGGVFRGPLVWGDYETDDECADREALGRDREAAKRQRRARLLQILTSLVMFDEPITFAAPAAQPLKMSRQPPDLAERLAALRRAVFAAKS